MTPVLRLSGEQIGSINPPPDGDWFVDFDEYEEFVPKRALDEATAQNARLRVIEEAAAALVVWSSDRGTGTTQQPSGYLNALQRALADSVKP